VKDPFDPREFGALAERLAASPDAGEAELRTAVGRAYYAVFLQARDRLGIRGARNIHHRVIAALKHRDPAAGNQLARLEDLRGVADYEMIVADPFRSDWASNWAFAKAYAEHISRRLAAL
jgi:hypothetical protein